MKFGVVYHQQDQANTAEQLAILADPILEQSLALHGYTDGRKFALRLYASLEAYGQSSELARTEYGAAGQANVGAFEIALAEPRLRNLTPEQLRNVIRRGATDLILYEQSGGKLPLGYRQGAAQYSESPTPGTEVGARELDRARRERRLFTWAQLDQAESFVKQPSLAAAQSQAIVAFLLDRYGLARWQRFVIAHRTATTTEAAADMAYSKSLATLDSEWQDYLAEYMAGAFRVNHFSRLNLIGIKAGIAGARYQESRDELDAVTRFIGGAGRAATEAEVRDLNGQVARGLEADLLLVQGLNAMASYDYAAAKDFFVQARERFERLGSGTKIDEVTASATRADAGLEAIGQLAKAQAELRDLHYTEARALAQAAIHTFADLSDEPRYRQAASILQDLDAQFLRIAYGVALLALGNLAWALWRLAGHRRRHPLPGVLQ